MDPFVAEIRIVGFNFAPSGWATCDGQLLPISQNTALFSLLGTFYGGNGQTNFALPDLQGAVPVSTGQSSAGGDYFVGQQSGVETITLLQSEIPAHTHTIATDSFDFGDNRIPSPNLILAQSNGANAYVTGPANAVMAPQALAFAGGSLPHNNMMPYLTLLFIIAMQGVFPQRS